MNLNCPTTTQFSSTPSTSLYDVSRHTVHNDARRPGAKLSKDTIRYDTISSHKNEMIT